MRSSSNPIADDIRRWAFTPDAEEPVQDWDLLLAATDQEDLFMELASDDACPNAEYLLGVLYFIVGDAVRTEYRTHSKAHIEGLLKKAEARFPKRCIYLWVQRSKYLMVHPESFHYDEWCAGILARRKDEEA
ncbi:MAG TPA: hypothetical protein VIM71_04075 [Lacunisphaera sp.]